MRVDRRIRFEYAACGRGNFESGKKKLRIQKFPDTCGRGPEGAKLMTRTLVSWTAQVASHALEFHPPRKHPHNMCGALLAAVLDAISKNKLTGTALRRRPTPGD